MNILYIDHYAGSEKYGMEFRPFYMAKEWQKLGAKTVIVAAGYSHLRQTNPKISKNMQEEVIDNITYCWIKTIKYNKNSFKRIISILQFVITLILYHKRIIRLYRPDVVICSSTYPLDTFAGQLISKISKARLIHEIHDLWPLTPMELGNYGMYNPLIIFMKIAEKSAYKNSDKIISILPNAKSYIRKLGISTDVINVPNGVILNAKNKQICNINIKSHIEKWKKENYFIVGYAGGLSISNAMNSFVSAAKELVDKKIVFFIIGDGIEKKNLKKFVIENDLKNVLFFDKINKNEINETIKLFDALYIGSKKCRLYEYGVSANKIFDYMLTGKPIINGMDTKHSPLNYSKTSIDTTPESKFDIAKKVIEVSQLSKEKLKEIKKNSIEYVIGMHNYKKLAKKFFDELS